MTDVDWRKRDEQFLSGLQKDLALLTSLGLVNYDLATGRYFATDAARLLSENAVEEVIEFAVKHGAEPPAEEGED